MIKQNTTTNENFNISAGTVSNLSTVNKFGRNSNCDNNVVTDIWDKTDQPIWIAPTTSQKHLIKSNNANDAAANTGAIKIKIYGLSAWTGVMIDEIINLNGITDVITVNDYIIIHRMKIIDTGGGAINFGTITATAQTDSTITAQINPAEGQTQMAIFGIPNGVTTYMTGYYVSIVKRAASLAAQLTLSINTMPEISSNIFTVKHTTGLATEGNNYIKHLFEPYMKIDGPAIIKISVNSSADNTDASAGFDLILKQ